MKKIYQKNLVKYLEVLNGLFYLCRRLVIYHLLNPFFMDFEYYNFYRIVGTSDQLVKNVLPLIEELSDSYRMAFFVFSNSEKSKNIGIVLAIHDHAESLNSELVYAGYIFSRHGIVPESCTYFEPKHPVDLSSPAAFAEDLPF